MFALADGGGTIHTTARITGKAASMGEGVVQRRAGRADHKLRRQARRDLIHRTSEPHDRKHPTAAMTSVSMREIREGEVPFDGGTAIQEDPDRPVFHGNGPNDYVCVSCGNVLAAAMHPVQMTKKVRVRCGRCSTVNVAVTEPERAP